MAKRLKVGIGGYGRSGCDIHARWLRNVQSKFEIVAVADQLPKRRKDARAAWGCRAYGDYGKLLKNTEMDLFINALPSALHGKGTVDACNAGINVVCEKPVGRTVKEFDSMLAAARKNRVKFLPFQNSRFFPFFKKMREVIDSGVLGQIVHVRTRWGGFGRRWDWQTLQEHSGGNLFNTGPHPMDHAIMLFGNKQPKVSCQMKAIHPTGADAENYCNVTLFGGHDDPVIEVVLNSFMAYPQGAMYNVCGTHGGLEGGPAGLTWKFFDPKKAPKVKMWPKWSKDRGYCGEKLPWEEKKWKPGKTQLSAFDANSKAFYKNVYDVLVNGKEQIVKHAEVRRQIMAIEECHRQNKLPRMKKKVGTRKAR